MHCPLCGARVGLLARDCACGFNLQTNDPAEAIVRARHELKTARKLLWIGLAGAIGTVLLALLLSSHLSWLDWYAHRDPGERLKSPKKALAAYLPLLVPMTACYGLGRGGWIAVRARRRLAVASRMQRPPTARVV